MKYTWNQYYHFSDKEIDQINQLVNLYNAGSIAPIDMRRYTKQVKRYAKSMKLIVDATEYMEWDWKEEKKVYKPWVDPKRFYIGRWFDLLLLPQECLWRLLKPMIEERKGYSITKLNGWLDVGIWPVGHKFHKKEDYEQMMELLLELDKWHYIIFQYAGDVWQITVTEDKAIRSEYNG